jgi:hypothetical protein
VNVDDLVSPAVDEAAVARQELRQAVSPQCWMRQPPHSVAASDFGALIGLLSRGSLLKRIVEFAQ